MRLASKHLLSPPPASYRGRKGPDDDWGRHSASAADNLASGWMPRVGEQNAADSHRRCSGETVSFASC
jgi:hypothetical protein